MGLDRTPGHFQLFGNFRIVTALQQQIGDLLLPWAQPDGLVCHAVLRRSLKATNKDYTGRKNSKKPAQCAFAGQPRRKKQKFWLVRVIGLHSRCQ
jgi:hypothetical protein